MIGAFPVTDIHVHLHPKGMIDPGARAIMDEGRKDAASIHALAEDPKAFLRFLDRCGIDRVGIVNYVAPDVMGYPPEVNDWAARFCAAAPDRLIAYGSVNPRFTQDAAGETERVLDLGVRILKVHPPHQLFQVNDYRTGGPGAAIGEAFRIAEDRGVPVVVHTGTSVFPGARNVYADPLPCDDVAVDFPRLPLVLAHAGRPLWTETAFFLARRHANVWIDLSGIPPRRLLEQIPRLPQIAAKCLWGSDWPGPGVPDPGKNAAQFIDLPLADDVKRMILDGNARRLIPV